MTSKWNGSENMLEGAKFSPQKISNAI